MITKLKNTIKSLYYRWFGFKHHIIKTSLPPAVWYDTDTRILYAVMDTIKWYVENDMGNIMTEEDLDNEINRIKDEHTSDMQDIYINELKKQYEIDNAILFIYKWWDNYPNREADSDEEEDWVEYDRLHDMLREEEQSMLKKAIDLRFHMWS